MEKNNDGKFMNRKLQPVKEIDSEESAEAVEQDDKIYCALCNTKCDSICATSRKKRGWWPCPELLDYYSANPRMRPKKKRFDRRERDDEDQFE